MNKSSLVGETIPEKNKKKNATGLGKSGQASDSSESESDIGKSALRVLHVPLFCLRLSSVFSLFSVSCIS